MCGDNPRALIIIKRVVASQKREVTEPEQNRRLARRTRDQHVVFWVLLLHVFGLQLHV